jgi:hypothetical protein
MLFDIHYPYGIPFYKDVDMITVSFQNNDDKEFKIYFYEKQKITKLAAIIFPKEKKKYQFPKGSEIAVLTSKGKLHCYIKLKLDWLYTYP